MLLIIVSGLLIVVLALLQRHPPLPKNKQMILPPNRIDEYKVHFGLYELKDAR